ncbi:MaoC family dehydratase [Cryobacterium sp. TmT2-59]|uniref:MaoC family dehydratase n=1 Tax=Cryobacterium shii TaxID=1259235 RepID=A0AAQ2C528_9MICO|nr:MULTISPECIES: MaoC family dehydratase [Cryobacterium]TFC44692.1 MaoC family dehydratase [Cryobacterium shii]TFC88138.1 MaoC family dehydratase [Cryobacterium sp. TmT2-59]
MADSAPLRVFSSTHDLIGSVGEELGPSPWMTVEQPAVDAFADVTQDWQALHCDPAFAGGSRYGVTIAHGYFTVSLLSMFARQLYRVDGVSDIINYGIDRLRFPAPVPVGSRIRARATLTSVSAKSGLVLAGVNYVVEIEGSPRPGLVADTLVALVPETAAEVPEVPEVPEVAGV